MILAHKQSSELLERSGKEALAAEIMREAVRPMGIEIDPEPAAQAASGRGGQPRDTSRRCTTRSGACTLESFIIQ